MEGRRRRGHGQERALRAAQRPGRTLWRRRRAAIAGATQRCGEDRKRSGGSLFRRPDAVREAAGPPAHGAGLRPPGGEHPDPHGRAQRRHRARHCHPGDRRKKLSRDRKARRSADLCNRDHNTWGKAGPPAGGRPRSKPVRTGGIGTADRMPPDRQTECFGARSDGWCPGVWCRSAELARGRGRSGGHGSQPDCGVVG